MRLLLCLWLLLSAGGAFAEVIDSARLQVGRVGKLDGFETYELRRLPDGYELTSRFEFSDRGTLMPLDLRVTTDRAFTPRTFTLKGKIDRPTSVDTAITVTNGTVSIRESGAVARNVAVGERFFIRSGFRPGSLQMLLVRYWLRQGKPARIPLLPAGEAVVTQSGTEVVRRDGRVAKLERYVIRVAGERDSVIWLDERGALAAAAGAAGVKIVRDDLVPSLEQLGDQADRIAIRRMEEITSAVRPIRSGKFALTGGNVIDLESGRATSGGVVLIRNGRIEYAGANRSIPRGYAVVDIRGKSVLPGLWDMHAHFDQATWAPLYLAAGVTTVRDVGNKPEFAVAVRQAVETRRARGPRMLLAGVIDGRSPNSMGNVVVASPEEAVAAVDRYARLRFDQIKVYTSITPEQLSAISETARRHGMSVTGHVPVTMSSQEALQRGLTGINHVATLLRGHLFDLITREKLSTVAAIAGHFDPASEEAAALIAELVRREIVLDPTLALLEFLWRVGGEPLECTDSDAVRIPAALRDQVQKVGVSIGEHEQAQRALAKIKEFLRRAHAAGVPIVAGTDIAIPGFALWRELELYVSLGMSPLEALRSATVVPAREMKRHGELATLRKGAMADLIVVDGDPLADISAIRRVLRVVKDGVLFDTAALWAAADFAPRRSEPLTARQE